MSYRDAQEAAQARIEALEAELATLRARGNPALVELQDRLTGEIRERQQAEVALAEAQAQLQLLQLEAAQKAAVAGQHAEAKLARAAAELRQRSTETEQLKRALEHREAQLAAQEEELQVLRTFSRDQALEFYTERVDRLEATVAGLERMAEALERQLEALPGVEEGSSVEGARQASMAQAIRLRLEGVQEQRALVTRRLAQALVQIERL